MKLVLNIYKKAGETPLEAINRFRADNPEYQSVKITYAGRLDPLAEGVLILLAGSTVYEKEKYLKLDKEYEAEIVFGFETDTYDILGMPTIGNIEKYFTRKEFGGLLNKFLGKNNQSFPPYSSYKIKGKPLFEWSREGRIKEIEIPKKQREIYEVKILRLQKINGKNLLAQINKKIKNVKGDFRQEKILRQWEKILKNKSAKKSQNLKNLKPQEIASLVGQLLAKKAKKAKINKVVFDRRGYHYHGRIKILADKARDNGLKI